eukprot:s1473_g13.t1
MAEMVDPGDPFDVQQDILLEGEDEETFNRIVQEAAWLTALQGAKVPEAIQKKLIEDWLSSFMEALAFGAGFYEEHWDKELSGAPFQVDYAVAPSETGSAPSVIEVDSYALKPKLVCSIVDGGGNGSSADWLQPRMNLDILKPLRQRFCQLAGEHHVVQRLLQHVKLPADRPFFAAEEVLAWRFEAPVGVVSKQEKKEFIGICLVIWLQAPVGVVSKQEKKEFIGICLVAMHACT